eukprot:scaffold53854_cov40-Phaeocystis_antarctica.AAC.2
MEVILGVLVLGIAPCAHSTDAALAGLKWSGGLRRPARGGAGPTPELGGYPVRLLLLDHVGEEQPHKTLLVDQARSPATTHREAPTLHTPCHPPARHLSPPVSPPLPHAQHAEFGVRGPLHPRVASAHLQRAAAARGGRGDSAPRGEWRCGWRVRATPSNTF